MKQKISIFQKTFPHYEKNNPSKFWKTIGQRSLGNDISIHNAYNTPYSDADIPIALNTFFTSVFTKEDNSSIPYVNDFDYHYMAPVDITLNGIAHLINNLKVSSSSGVDEINSKILKNTTSVSSVILLHIYKQSLSTSELPTDWKIGKVVPVFKSGNKHSHENYRPISLTCICCKMLEHIIASHIYDHLESNHFFFPNQHGFRKGFSCESQLFEFTTDLHYNMNDNLQIDCIFLDFSKAFDRVAHCRLISKLSALRLDSLTLSWVHNFLTAGSSPLSIITSLLLPMLHPGCRKVASLVLYYS